VFGIAPVKTTQRTASGAGYATPACQTKAQPVYESQLLQALYEYYVVKLGQDLVWCLMLGDQIDSTTTPSGFAAFGQINIPCLLPQRIDLVRVLPNAQNSLTQTPYRYYVVPVVSCTILPAGGKPQRFASFPKFLMLDSGTTNVQLTSSADSTALNSLGPGDKAELVLGTRYKSVTIIWTSDDTTWMGSPTFGLIGAGLGGQLSSKNDVGILGSTGMRHLFLEFNLTANTVGFAQIRTRSR
jgi:hypothetical protein